ncbi:MAG: tetratricopeptide repeat protein [Elusimicrobia bacterium]|nr:tetratricopeptide repeat protein [Elusimicrobiota bacterium]
MPTIADFLSQGMEFFKAGKLPEAAACFGAALKADETLAPAWSMLGICFHRTGKLQEGLDCFDRAVKLAPDSAPFWSNRAHTLNAMDRFEEGLASADKALERDEALADAWNNKGVSLQCLGSRDRQLGRVQEALRCFNRALQLDGRHALAQKNKERAVGQIRQIDQVEAAQPATAQEWFERGRGLGGAEAVRSFAKALELDPRHAQAWLHKALAEGQGGRIRQSVVSALRFLDAAGPEFAQEIGFARELIARARLDGVPTDGALPPGLTDEALDKALGQSFQASEHNGAGRHEQGLNAAENALALHPGCPNAWYHKGFALDALGRDGEALACFNRALELAPDFWAAWQNKAALLCELGRWEESLPCWDRVAQLKPGEGQWLDQKAKALARLGRADEAAQLTLKALEDPRFAEEHHRRGRELLKGAGLEEPPKLSRAEEAQLLDALVEGDMSRAPRAVREQAERLERESKAGERPPQPEAQAWTEKAQSLLGRRTPEGIVQALAAAEQALSLEPDLPLPVFLKGTAELLLGRVCASARELARFRELAWASQAKQVELADEFLAAFRGAGVPARMPEPDAARRIDAAYAKGEAAGERLSAGRHAEALAAADEALALHPGHPNAWFLKARCLERQGRADEAARCHLEAGRLLPEFANAWFSAAKLLVALGKGPETLAAVDQGLAGVGEDHKTRTALLGLRFQALVLCGRIDEALAVVDGLLEDPAVDATFRALLAQARAGLPQGPEAPAARRAAGAEAVAAADHPPGTAREEPREGPRRGELIGDKYEVLETLGMGGFGVVYKVYSRQTRTVHALKTFREEYLADAGTRDGFKREAQTWLDLDSHPYLVKALFVDELGGRLYIAMEFIASERDRPNSVEGWLRRGPIPLDLALRWSIELCHGMEHAVRRGIRCHRDLKPANLLVGRDGSLRVSDFGLAAALGACRAASGPRLDVRGSAVVLSRGADGGVGTPPYMPPEQFSPSGACDERSDVYAFGATLYQMLSGRLPFSAPLPCDGSPEEARRFWSELERRHREAAPEPLESPLWPVVARCLEKDPARRFQGFAELRAPLEGLLAERGGAAVSPPPPRRLAAWEWNNRGISLNDLGRFDDALACFDRALEADAADARLWSNKALALSGLGRHEDAASAADQAIALGSGGAAAWNAKGAALLGLGRRDDAGDCFRRAAASSPGDADGWANLALVERLEGRFTQALECADKALAADAGRASAWTEKGLDLDLLGRHEEALACYRKATQLDPFEQTAWMNIGIIRRRQGDAEDALRHYEKALEIDPAYPNLWFNKGVAEEELGRLAAARASYARFLELGPGPELGPQAERARRKVAELEPRPAPATRRAPAAAAASQAASPAQAQEWLDKAAILMNQGQWERARETLARALEAKAGGGKAWLDYGRCLLELARADEALRAAGEAVEKLARNAEAWLLKARCLNALRRDAEAVPAYDEALRREPRLVRALLGKGQSLYLLGYRKQLGEAGYSGGLSHGVLQFGPPGEEARSFFEAALACCDAALALEPLNFNGRHLKGTTHLALGQKDEGAKAYRQFLASAPMTCKAARDEALARLKELGGI